MKYLIEEAKEVADSFFDLTKSIRDRSVLTQKDNELVLIGIFSSTGALRGLQTHIHRALEVGANKDEILSVILLALPVIGIAKVNQALESAMEVLNKAS